MSRLHFFSFFFLFLASFFFSLPLFLAAHVDGEDDPLYKDCVAQCKKSGCVGDICIDRCEFSSDGKQGVCETECQYHCMQSREEERKKQKHGENPVKCHGKWPFQRVFGIQEPVAAALSALNLAIVLHGWISFPFLVYYTLPLRPNYKTYYEYTGWWHICGVLSTIYYFCNVISHCRDVKFPAIDPSAAFALLTFNVLLGIVLAFNSRDNKPLMVEVLLVTSLSTHILYLESHKPDSAVYMYAFKAITISHPLYWATWAITSSHPGRWKLGMVVMGVDLAMFIEKYEFPPYMGYVDSHALWHATAIPITYLLWSYIRDDAVFRTLIVLLWEGQGRLRLTRQAFDDLFNTS